MSQVRLQLDEEILSLAERLAAERGLTMEALFAELVRQVSQSKASATDPVLGLFSDEPDLMDQVAEDILCSRETQPLRTPHG